MGLLDKLFKKKICSCCNQEIKPMGARKLLDGYMCKTCEAKLSPFFSDRRNSTTKQILGQLVYRDQNQKDFAAFHTTLVLGKDSQLWIDEDAQKFVAVPWQHSGSNPDVLHFSQIMGCSLTVSESSSEEKQTNEEGDRISYDPPRYHYSYQFTLTILVRHRYFQEISFPLSRYRIKTTVGTGITADRKPDPMTNPEYAQYVQIGNEMKQFLLEARQIVRTVSESNTSVVCPWCGRTTEPDKSGQCEFCCGIIQS